jgi:hypothetical protein
MNKPKKNIQSPNRASTSMSLEEIDVLDRMLVGLRGGADLRILARTCAPQLGRLAVRVAVMRASMRARASAPQTTEEDDHGPD